MNNTLLTTSESRGVYPKYALGIHIKANLIRNGFNINLAKSVSDGLQTYFANRLVHINDGEFLASMLSREFECFNLPFQARPFAYINAIEEAFKLYAYRAYLGE